VSPDAPEERRSAAEIRAHYEIERELAARLRTASRAERRTLYAELYDELLRRVESHPLMQKTGDGGTTTAQLRLIERYLDTNSVFLEIGAGDCALALVLADRVQKVYAIEVSAEIIRGVSRRENVEIVVTDGLSIPIPHGSATLAYSNQVFEHLHPDDALDHLRQVCAALAPGGRYVCVTPNRLTGPHDISKYFDTTATGFHLREYTAVELAGLMESAGFERAELWAMRRGVSSRLPRIAVLFVERSLGLVSASMRRRVARALPFRVLLECFVVGIKPLPPAA
jgi:SAM-dependent methyltransferase